MSRVVGRTARRIGERLKTRGWQVGLVETLSGGTVSDRLTDVPGSSAYFAGSINAPSFDRLAGLSAAGDLGRSAGAVATWSRAELRVDLGVAVIAQAGAESLQPGGPVEIALAGPDFSSFRTFRPRSTGAAWQDAVGRTVLRTIDRALADRESGPSPR